MNYHQILEIPGKTWYSPKTMILQEKMGYHQFRHVILLAKLGFQGIDGIHCQEKTWFSSKNMEYHQKDHNRWKVEGDPIYIEDQRIAWLLEAHRNYTFSYHLLPQFTHSRSSQWAKIARAKTIKTNSTHSSIRVHTEEGWTTKLPTRNRNEVFEKHFPTKKLDNPIALTVEMMTITTVITACFKFNV